MHGFPSDSPQGRCYMDAKWANSNNIQRWIEFLLDGWPEIGYGTKPASNGLTTVLGNRVLSAHFDIPHDATPTRVADMAGKWVDRLEVKIADESGTPDDMVLLLPVNHDGNHWSMVALIVSALFLDLWLSVGSVVVCGNLWESVGNIFI